MSAKSLSLLTPIKYDIQLTWRQTAIELVDSYFHLWGPVATVVPSSKKNGIQYVRLESHPVVWWHSALKVMSYVASFLILLAAVPAFAARPKVTLLQIAAGSIPLLLFISKIAMRSTSQFYVDGLIDPQVKEVLDDLLEGSGSVDQLPIHKENSVEGMTAPIMKGYSVNAFNQRLHPQILIKLRCLSTEEQINAKYLIPPTLTPQVTIILTQAFINKPRTWIQESEGTPYPAFLTNYPTISTTPFTDVENGKITEEYKKGFELLKKLIREGSGEDTRGLRWEIVQPTSEK
jgi:hypothetical protein